MKIDATRGDFRFGLLGVLIVVAVSGLWTGQARAGTTVYADQYGWNATDSTTALQSAISSGADTVIVRDMGSPWIVEPVFLTSSNQHVIFEPGVEVLAKQGSFLGGSDNLLRAYNVQNVTLTGYGATLRMRREDYQSAPYSNGDWRHAIRIDSSDGITVEGFNIRDSGGDGIYVTGTMSSKRYSSNIVVRDVLSEDNDRLAFTVISADNILFENVIMRGNSYDSPAAAIDFEPNYADQRIRNAVVRNAYAQENYAGYIVAVKNLRNQEVSVEFDRCVARDIRDGSFHLSQDKADTSLTGTVTYNDCRIFNSRTDGYRFYNKLADTIEVTMNDVHASYYGWVSASYRKTAVVFDRSGDGADLPLGDVTINDAVFNDTLARVRPQVWTQFSYERPFKDVNGNFTVNTTNSMPSDGWTDLGTQLTNVNVTDTYLHNAPPTAAIDTPAFDINDIPMFTEGDPLVVGMQAFDPDVGTNNGDGISAVTFELWRGTQTFGAFTDTTPDYGGTIDTTGFEQGYYLLHVTVESNDGGIEYDVMPLLFVPQTEAPVPGDTNGDGALDAQDIDHLYDNLTGSGNPTYNTRHDIDGDGDADPDDVTMLVEDLLGTYFGDANLDGVVDEADLAYVADGWKQHAGEDYYTWGTGDFDGTGYIAESDLAYVADAWKLPAKSASTAPEPATIILLGPMSLLGLRKDARP
jgi:hypothetical protein